MLSMREYFNQFKTIVVLGASSDPYRTSYHIARYLQQNGYRIVPVNPNEEEVLGEKSYPTLADLPQDIEADAVVIFRNGTCPISVSVLSSCEVNNLGVFSHSSHGNNG